MQPYQSASEEIRRQGELPSKVLKAAGGIAIGSKLSGLALSSVMPLLSKYVPEGLAIKGLNKIDPRFGKFINKALENGFSFDEVKDFMTEKADESVEQQEPAKEGRNIIQQYSPELFEFIDQEIKKGRNPIEAGALAQNDKRFSDVIKKLSKDHKTPWSNILQSVFGDEVNRQGALKKFNDKLRKPSMVEEEQERFNQGAGQQQQPGQGQAALMQVLQSINQRFGPQ